MEEGVKISANFFFQTFLINLASPFKPGTMTEFDNSHSRDAHFSKRVRAGKRTYYFDVKATRGNDYYLTITESKRKPGESEDRPFFEKHKLFLYKEDFEKFTDGLHEALEYIRHKRENGENHAPVTDGYTEASGSTFSDLNFEDLGQ
jgi:hypothetical protein